MSKQRTMYKLEASATNSSNKQAPINGATQVITLVKPGRIVGIRAYATAVATDTQGIPETWNMPCLGRVAINHGNGVYANNNAVTPAFTNVHFENRVQEALNIPVSAGQLSVFLYVNPIYLRHVKTDMGSVVFYTTVTAAISVVIEVEED